MKIILASLVVASMLHAKTYEGCASNKQDALFELSSNIKSSIKNNFEQSVQASSEDESVETTVSSYINASTNLSLVDIQYKDAKDGMCAYVEHEAQTKNTQKLLDAALLYEASALPQDNDAKIKKLSTWLDDIEQLGFLVPVFLDNTAKEQVKLAKKEKEFRDLYTQALAYSESLVFKACAKDQEKALKELNEQLFKDKSKKESKGFFSSLADSFSSDEPMMIEMFNSQLSYAQKEQKQCAIIKKEELLAVTKKMDAKIKYFNTKSLEKDPKKRYKQIENLYEHINVTKALLALYPQQFDKNDITKLDNTKEQLEKIQSTTYPQFVQFQIADADATLKIKLDTKNVKNNEKNYLAHGEHSYTISMNNRCPIKGSFSTELFEDKEISESFDDMAYPTILFVTDQTPNIVVDGQVIKPNVVTQIKKCEGEVRYIVKFAGQTQSGMYELGANEKETIELDFLTAGELAIFNDAKTKKFTTASGEKFSESLTVLASERMEFVVEEKPSHGELDIHPRGSFKYTPNEGFIGVDSFEYVIKTVSKTSAPKVVSISVKGSNMPIVATPLLSQENNETVESVKEEINEKADDVSKEAEERYQRFKAYVDSQEQNVEKLQKLKEKYPDMFERLLKEKLTP